MLVTVALLTGALVAVSGSIGFVGLVVPHAVRLVVGTAHRRLLALTALVGRDLPGLGGHRRPGPVRAARAAGGHRHGVVGAPVFAALLRRRAGGGLRCTWTG